MTAPDLRSLLSGLLNRRQPSLLCLARFPLHPLPITATYQHVQVSDMLTKQCVKQ